MENMSETFLMAYAFSQSDKEEAIRLYSEELDANPKNIAAWGNRGLCRLELSIERKDQNLLQASKEDFRKGLEICEEKNYSRPNVIDANLQLAEATKFD